ncbi:hypothetical protein AAC387_Pa07g1010 [Persea americana]
MFESIPHADAVFLKWLLHACSDEECVKILRRCKEAIPSKEEGGKVIILEMVLNANKDHKPMETQLYFDVLMLVNTKGREREEHEWRKIFMDAGFDDYKISPVLGLRHLNSLVTIKPDNKYTIALKRIARRIRKTAAKVRQQTSILMLTLSEGCTETLLGDKRTKSRKKWSSKS